MNKNNIEPIYLGEPKVLITQAHNINLSATYSKLKEYFNATVDFRSFTEVKFIAPAQFRIHKPMVIEQTAFLITGRAILNGFFNFVKECSIFLPKETKYFLATEELKSYLCKYVELRKRKVFCGSKQLEDLLPIMHKHKNEKFLFPCSNLGRKSISDFFKKKKYQYTELPIYENGYADLSDLNPEQYDVIAFFSPLAVKAFAKNFPNYAFEKTAIAALGEKTIKAAKEAGWTVMITAPTKETPSMISGLIDYFDGLNNQNKEVEVASSAINAN